MKALRFVIPALALLAIGPAFAAAPAVTGPAAIPVIAPSLAASFSAQPATFSGACPVTIKFKGTITGSAGQSVSYYFTRTVKGIAAATMPVTANLDAAGKVNVADSIAIDGTHAGPGSDELDLISSAVKAKASFAVTCVAATALSPSIHMAQVPAVLGAHVFVPEGTGIYYYPYPQYIDTSKCGGFPPSAIWQNGMLAYLRSGFIAEKAYLQEKAAYDPNPSDIGFSPEPPQAFCIKFIFTVGHYADQPYKSDTFVMTARHINGGPMLCITDVSGTGHSAGEPGISNAGGPIDTPQACGALPTATAVNPLPYQRVVPH